MRIGFALSLPILLAACAPPAPHVPAPAPLVPAEMPPDLSSTVKPASEPRKVWCYDAGSAPAPISPHCNAEHDGCDRALAEARRVAAADGSGELLSECHEAPGAVMMRPHRLSGRAPVYSQAARDAGVQGRVVAECVVRSNGSLTDCKILESVPLLDQAVLDALATWRFEPARFQGHAINVAYKIPFKFAAP